TRAFACCTVLELHPQEPLRAVPEGGQCLLLDHCHRHPHSALSREAWRLPSRSGDRPGSASHQGGPRRLGRAQLRPPSDDRWTGSFSHFRLCVCVCGAIIQKRYQSDRRVNSRLCEVLRRKEDGGTDKWEYVHAQHFWLTSLVPVLNAHTSTGLRSSGQTWS